MVIVDDDPQVCKTLGDILEARGFSVVQVTQPSALTDKLRPMGQVVLLAVKLNSISGLAVLKEIRKQHPRP